MQRIEIYISNNGKLTLGVFASETSEYEKYVLKGERAYKYIRVLKNKKIKNIVEDTENMTLIYNNYVVNLNEYEELLNRRGLKVIIEAIKQYKQNELLKKVKGKKVKRKNKYVNRRLMAGSLTLLILVACALGLFKNKKEAEDLTSSITSSQEAEEELESKIYLEKNDNIDLENEETHETLEIDQFEDNTQSTEITEDPLFSVSVNYEDRSNTTKAYNTQDNYGDLITKYAKKYGIDPFLTIAIATQERGVHSSKMDSGGATGLMQIQNEVWVGQKISAYNFQTGKTESFVVTIDQLRNVESNIRIGCMILQNSFQYMKYNPLAAIQCYNMGYGNMMNILNEYAVDNDKTIDDVLSNIEDDGWLSYRENITQGDQRYIENVLSWMGEEVHIKNIKIDGTIVELNINNNFNSKKVY